MAPDCILPAWHWRAPRRSADQGRPRLPAAFQITQDEKRAAQCVNLAVASRRTEGASYAAAGPPAVSRHGPRAGRFAHFRQMGPVDALTSLADPEIRVGDGCPENRPHAARVASRPRLAIDRSRHGRLDDQPPDRACIGSHHPAGSIATFSEKRTPGLPRSWRPPSPGCGQTENDFEAFPVAIRWQFPGRRARNPIMPG